jgi:ABC-2 type transport system permease protein
VIFVISIQVSKITPGHGPYKTPLGPNLRHTGMAIDLVVLKLIASVGPTLVVALVAGDIVASEDMAGTLKTILVRSLSRGEILAGKALALFAYVIAALGAYALAGLAAGILAWGFHPMTNLSGHQLSAPRAFAFTLLALVIYGVPVLAIACFGLLLSVLTRQSVAAVAGTLLYVLCLQGLAALSAVAPIHPYLLVNQLTAWHDLFETPTAGAAIVRAVWVSAIYAALPLAVAVIVFRRRDVTT